MALILLHLNPVGMVHFPVTEASIHTISLLEALLGKIGRRRLAGVAMVAVHEQGFAGICILYKGLDAGVV